VRVATLALAVLAAAARGRAAEPPTPTYRVDWIVRVDAGDPAHAHVTWRFAGIDEIASFRVVFRDTRARDVQGTGTLAWDGPTLRWTPGGPYAHLDYVIAIDRHRPPGGARYDSRADAGWIATRARHLFPEVNVVFRSGTAEARSEARLLFELPAGWQSVAIGAPLGPHAFRVDEPGKRLDRPRGWFLLGRDLHIERGTIAGSDITVACAPGSRLDVARLWRFWSHTAPLLVPLLGPPPERLLMVSAPDPMWRGGISGEDSFFVNGRIPTRSPDETSTYLHELVHVWKPFRVAADARWFSEGLAEYASLLLQYRAGLLDDARFAHGLQLFADQGVWGQDLTQTRAPAAMDDSAPLVVAALDLELQRATDGRARLDDLVRGLAGARGTLTTAHVQAAASRVAGRDLSTFFRRHVLHGEAPPVPIALASGLSRPGAVRYTRPSGRAATP
jgi:hypothetical protein